MQGCWRGTTDSVRIKGDRFFDQQIALPLLPSRAKQLELRAIYQRTQLLKAMDVLLAEHGGDD